MAIDTLAYAKALIRCVLPELVTADDLAAAGADLERAIEQIKHELQMTIECTAHQQTVRLFGMLVATVGLMDAILFAPLRFVH